MPRTTIDLDASVLAELREYARARGESLGAAATYLLDLALKQNKEHREPPEFEWLSKDMGLPRIETGIGLRYGVP